MKRHIIPAVLALLAIVPAAVESQPAAPRITIAREMRIDGNSNNLVTMRSILVLSNGTMVVDQDQDGAIRYFSREGAPLRTFGRKGDGPGEFRSVRYIGLLGDSIWVYDVSQERFTHVTPDYKVARTVPLLAAEPGPRFASTLPHFAFPYVKAAYPGGTYLIEGGIGMSTPLPASYPKNRSPWVRINDSAIVQSVVLWRRDNPASLHVVTATAVYGWAIPFVQEDLEDVSDNGSRIAFSAVTVRGTAGGTFHITMLGARGDTLYSRDYPFRGVAIPKRISDSTWDAALQRSRARAPELLAAMSAAGPTQPVYPPLQSLTVGRDGSLWIQMRQPGLSAPERFWLVLDAKGEPFGTLVAPANLSIVTADLSTFWGFEMDADDVQSIVRYRVTSPRR